LFESVILKALEPILIRIFSFIVSLIFSEEDG
jgi:hypothetical protein